jgi:hypothetical protein
MPLRLPSPKRIAVTAAKGLSALGYVLFGSILCVSSTGLPLVSGLFAGVAVGTRFGISAGAVSAVVLFYVLLRRRSRVRRRAPCRRPAETASRASPRLDTRTKSSGRRRPFRDRDPAGLRPVPAARRCVRRRHDRNFFEVGARAPLFPVLGLPRSPSRRARGKSYRRCPSSEAWAESSLLATPTEPRLAGDPHSSEQ